MAECKKNNVGIGRKWGKPLREFLPSRQDFSRKVAISIGAQRGRRCNAADISLESE